MNPSVEAAWIAGASGLIGVLVGVTGTAIVGIAGFRSTRSATAATNTTTRDLLQEQLHAAREDRVYDNRASVYVDALETMSVLDSTRSVLKEAAGGKIDKRAEERLSELNTIYSHSDEHKITARLQAFGTPEAFAAFLAAVDANQRVIKAFGLWAAGGRQTAAAAELISAIEASDTADRSLVELIRRELIGAGPPLPAWRPPK